MNQILFFFFYGEKHFSFIEQQRLNLVMNFFYIFFYFFDISCFHLGGLDQHPPRSAPEKYSTLLHFRGKMR